MFSMSDLTIASLSNENDKHLLLKILPLTRHSQIYQKCFLEKIGMEIVIFIIRLKLTEFCCIDSCSQIFHFVKMTKEVTKTDLLIFYRFFYQKVFRICSKILHWKISIAHHIKKNHSILGLIYDFI